MLEELEAREAQAGITPDPEARACCLPASVPSSCACFKRALQSALERRHAAWHTRCRVPSATHSIIFNPPTTHPPTQVDAYMKATWGVSAWGGGRGNLIVDLVLRLLGLDVCADTGGWVCRMEGCLR